MINEIKERLVAVVYEAAGYFANNGYEARGKVEVSDVEDGFNTYLFPTISITCPEDSELEPSFGFAVEIDKDGKYSLEDIESDIAEFLAKAKECAEAIDNAENKCEAIRELEKKLAEEVESTIKAEAELAAKREAAAIKATYRQALLIACAMALVAIAYFIVTKLF